MPTVRQTRNEQIGSSFQAVCEGGESYYMLYIIGISLDIMSNVNGIVFVFSYSQIFIFGRQCYNPNYQLPSLKVDVSYETEQSVVA